MKIINLKNEKNWLDKFNFEYKLEFNRLSD